MAATTAATMAATSSRSLVHGAPGVLPVRRRASGSLAQRYALVVAEGVCGGCCVGSVVSANILVLDAVPRRRAADGIARTRATRG